MTAAADMTAADRPIRALIVDDHAMFASSLAFVLDAEPDIQVIDTAATAAAAVAKATATRPDVILLDHRLPDGDGLAIIPTLRELRPSPQIVMLTASTSDRLLVAAIEAGVAGFIDKSRDLAEVLAVTRAAASGETTVNPSTLARLLPRLHRSADLIASTITEREREVLQLLALGLTNADIAERLTVSVHTVRNHVANLSGKLGAHSKLEALSIAIRHGLIDS